VKKKDNFKDFLHRIYRMMAVLKVKTGIIAILQRVQ